MNATTCRCCGRTDPFAPAPGVIAYRGPLCVPCTVDHHRHTWLPAKTWEQIDAERYEQRLARSFGVPISQLSW